MQKGKQGRDNKGTLEKRKVEDGGGWGQENKCNMRRKVQSSGGQERVGEGRRGMERRVR